MDIEEKLKDVSLKDEEGLNKSTGDKTVDKEEGKATTYKCPLKIKGQSLSVKEYFKMEYKTIFEYIREEAVRLESPYQQLLYQRSKINTYEKIDPNLIKPSFMLYIPGIGKVPDLSELNELNREVQIKELRAYLGENMEAFVKSPIKFFIHVETTGTDDEKKPYIETHPEMPIIIKRLNSIVIEASELVKEMYDSATKDLNFVSMEEWFKNENYSNDYKPGIEVLYKINKEFTSYLCHAICLTNELMTISDIVNEAAQEVTKEKFYLYEIFIRLYYTDCYRVLKNRIIDAFTLAIKMIFNRMKTSKMPIELLNKFLQEKHIEYLKSISNFLVDMEISEDNICSINSSKSESIDTNAIKEGLKKYGNSLTFKSISESDELCPLLQIYAGFLSGILIPQASGPIISSIFGSVINNLNKLKSDPKTGSLIDAKIEELEKALKNWVEIEYVAI